MLRIHFFTAIRTLVKNRTVTLINILGLAISLTAFLFIIHYYLYENSYDAFFNGSEQVYRVNLTLDKKGQQIFKGAQTPRALYFFAKDEIPEVEANTITYFESCLIKCNNQSFNAQPVLWVDEGFDKVFSLQFKQGKADFARPLTAIISEGKAKSLFGKENPIGKIIKVNEGMPVEVTGVYTDLPANTHLKADYFISMKTFVHYGWIGATGDWAGNNWWNYLRLKPGSSVKAVEQKLDEIGGYRFFLKEREETAHLSLQSLNDVHYLSGLTGEFGAVTNKKSLYNLLIIGVFIVVIAWINFVNLSTARAEKKKFELGVKKILGATQWHLWLQSFFECLLINAIAFTLAFFIYKVLLDPFAKLFTLPLSTAYIPQTKLIGFLLIVFISGILFSSLSGTFNIVRSGSWNLKNQTKAKTGFKKGLVIVQLVISIVFISGTMLVFKQMRFMQMHDLGMKIDHVITVDAPVSLNISPVKREKYDAFRRELATFPQFAAGTATMNIPGEEPRWRDIEYFASGSNSQTGSRFCENNADDGFIKTYSLRLVAGNTFNAIPDHNSNKVLINEQAAKSLGFNAVQDAVGKYLYKKGDSSRKEIIGVIGDFHNESLQKPIYPMIWNNDHPYEFGHYSFLVHGGDPGNALKILKRVWNKHYSEDPFHYFFADALFNDQYTSELRFGRFYMLLAILSISISCLGLYGLLLFYLVQKSKEIAIRKISGAYVPQLVLFINKGFIKWNIIAFFIACPLVYLISYRWLQNFAYKTTISWWVFILAGCATFIITCLTVSWQAYKAANQKMTVAIRQV